MSMRGASASCRKNSFSPGIVRINVGSLPRDSTWKLSKHIAVEERKRKQNAKRIENGMKSIS